jgi:hypothetical protein
MKTFGLFILAAYCMAILVGCQAVKYIGATPIEDHNKTVVEVERFSKDISVNQGAIGMVTVELANENILTAKKDDDKPKLERAIETKVKAQMATKEANKLSEIKFEKIEGNDFSGLLDILMGILSALFPALAGYLIMLRNQLGRVTAQGKIYASTPQTFDLSGNKDFK